MKHRALSRLVPGLVTVLGLASACGAAAPVLPDEGALPTDARCVMAGEPRVVVEEGAGVLLVWEGEWREVWGEAVLPQSDALETYRDAIARAGGALRRPVADPVQPADEREREVWRREDRNVELAFAGHAGEVRPIQCLEALLFAWQAERFSQLEHPTEFIAAILRRTGDDGATQLRVYYAAADTMFPPRELYPFDAAAADVAAGWTFWRALHNHTVRTLDGRPALGVPAPSTNDVMLSRHLVEALGLELVQVTNGLFTVDIDAAQLEHYELPPP